MTASYTCPRHGHLLQRHRTSAARTSLASRATSNSTGPRTACRWSVVNRDGYLSTTCRTSSRSAATTCFPSARDTPSTSAASPATSPAGAGSSRALDTPGGTVYHFLEKAGSQSPRNRHPARLTASWRFPIVTADPGFLHRWRSSMSPTEQRRTNWSTALLLSGDLDRGGDDVADPEPTRGTGAGDHQLLIDSDRWGLRPPPGSLFSEWRFSPRPSGAPRAHGSTSSS